MADATHRDLILDQFTRQASPFSTAATIADDTALRRIVAAAEAGPEDTVLDVACGPGLVVCAFAPHVRRATGIDMTPAMLDRARLLAAERGLANVAWDEGDVTRLPYPDGNFSIVVTRFSMHHFLEPAAVMREMARVCAAGGRVVVVDDYASEDPAQAAAFNRLEKLRDPSHVRALALSELKALFGAAGLPRPRGRFYEMRDEVKNLLARSFPNPGDDRKIVEMFRASAADGRLGVPVRLEGERIHYAYPIAILAARRPATAIPAPFARYQGEVLPAWIDANGHMNLAYYVVLFDSATDMLFDALDIGVGYKNRTGNGTFAAESHILYERELLAGERVRVTSQILACDDKRLHLAHEMFALAEKRRAAAQELLYLHIDLARRRVAPFPSAVRERVARAAAAHAALPRPLWVGRRIAMPGRGRVKP